MLLEVPEETNVGLVRVSGFNCLEGCRNALESLVTVRPYLTSYVHRRIRPVVAFNEHEEVSTADPCCLRGHRQVFRVLCRDVPISLRKWGPSGLNLFWPCERKPRSMKAEPPLCD